MGNENTVKLISLDTIPVQEVEWLVYPFIPCGKITIIQGDPGEGKTTFILQLIARLTTGRPAWDGMSPMTPGNVIYQTAEDGLSDTIKPRLVAAGAACDKVLVIDDSDRALTLEDDRLEQAIVQTHARLVVLDPIQGYIGAGVDMHRANEIRPLMHKHYSRCYDGIYILFHTGLRISEFCGLTMQDIEFSEMRIKVDHQLQRTSQMEYVIQRPKTERGIRYIPMTEDVAACFRRIIANRRVPKGEPMVNGYAGFLFLDKNDMPMVALHWQKYLQHIVEKYNRIYRIPMPKVTPHVCRHTFCSNMAKSGMNPKTLQYIMGHADISVTLNTYTHVSYEDAKGELLRLAHA